MSFYRWHLGIAIGSLVTLYTNSSVAQITPDGTLSFEGGVFRSPAGRIEVASVGDAPDYLLVQLNHYKKIIFYQPG